MVKNSNRQAALFDIRLNNLDHDVLVLKGSPQDSPAVLLAGKIVLSVMEPFHIKKLTLRLYSTLRLNWNDTYHSVKGPIPRPVKFEKKIYEYVWENFDLSPYTTTSHEIPHKPSLLKSHANNSSTSSLKNLGSTLLSKSSSNLNSLSSLSLASHNIGQANVLPQGNYEFPFSTVLPGSIPESVEGLPGGSAIYKLVATIERGRFSNSLLTKKHLRVIRTLTPDSVELSETMAVDNTWPEKVDYSISIPSRAVAIGSGTAINILLVPLLKGLKLGKIKISLVEYYSYCGAFGPTCNDERIVVEQKIPRPADNTDVQLDKWEVDSFLQFPPNLSKCTQDCDIVTNMKVRHKLKFVIGLVNPDGHVSELRASLPIIIFISPFVAVRAKNEDFGSETGSNNGDYTIHDTSPEQVLFSEDPHSLSATSLNSAANDETTAARMSNPNQDILAPPMYEKHIYDRLWSDITPIESPIQSGAVTPNNYNQSSEVSDHFAMSPMDPSYNQLTENLRQLSLQRQLQDGNTDSGLSFSTRSGRPAFSITTSGPNSVAQTPEEHHNPGDEAQDYFSVNANGIVASPGVMSPPVQHLSRANSGLNDSHRNDSVEWDTDIISRVPSYLTAVKSDSQLDLTPAYEPPLPGSNINLDELNRRFEVSNNHSDPQLHHANGSQWTKSKLRPLSRGSSAINLRVLRSGKDESPISFELSKSRGSSTNSSPGNSRSVSFTNLSALNNHPVVVNVNPANTSKAPNRSNISISSLTPMTPISNTSIPPLPKISQGNQTSASNTNAGLQNPVQLSRSPTGVSSSSSSSKSHSRTKSGGNIRPESLSRTNSKSSTHLTGLSNLSFLHKKNKDDDHNGEKDAQ